MVIPENQDGKSEEPENLLEPINSRKGGKLMKEKPRVRHAQLYVVLTPILDRY
jgi:hypothetical protein